MECQWIDTHAHLFHKDFQHELPEVLQRSAVASVQAIYLPNLNAETIMRMKEVAKAQEVSCYPCMGLHPCYVEERYEEELLLMEQELELHSYAAYRRNRSRQLPQPRATS